jgi:hypothetical protein
MTTKIAADQYVEGEITFREEKSSSNGTYLRLRINSDDGAEYYSLWDTKLFDFARKGTRVYCGVSIKQGTGDRVFKNIISIEPSLSPDDNAYSEDEKRDAIIEHMPRVFDRESSIHRQVAFKGAIELVKNVIAVDTEVNWGLVITNVETLTDAFDDLINRRSSDE